MAGEWQAVELGPRARKIGSGATPRGGREAYLDAGPFALIRSQNVHDFEFIREGLAFIDPDQAAALSNVEVEPLDVLINITGDSVARVCMVDAHVLPARVNQHVSIVRADPTEFDQRFLFYSLVAPRMKEHLLGLASAGATRNALTKSDLEKLKVAQPPLLVQQSVGNLLGALDDKIELNRRMAETLEAMARALFKSWFVDFDPVHAKAESRPTGLPDDLAALFPDRLNDDGLPVAWSSTAGSIGELARATVEPQEVGADTPYLGLEHFDQKHLIVSRWGHAGDVDSVKMRFAAGDLLFGKLRPYFHKVAIAPFSGICSSDIFVFRPVGQVPRTFLYLTFSQDRFVEAASNAAEGTRMPRADWNFMRRLPAALPCAALLMAFDKIVAPMISSMLARSDESQNLAALRDSLLPKLILGQLRVADAETHTSAA
jgi:type I restriction enzyme S subunit